MVNFFCEPKSSPYKIRLLAFRWVLFVKVKKANNSWLQ